MRGTCKNMARSMFARHPAYAEINNLWGLYAILKNIHVHTVIGFEHPPPNSLEFGEALRVLERKMQSLLDLVDLPEAIEKVIIRLENGDED